MSCVMISGARLMEVEVEVEVVGEGGKARQSARVEEERARSVDVATQRLQAGSERSHPPQDQYSLTWAVTVFWKRSCLHQKLHP